MREFCVYHCLYIGRIHSSCVKGSHLLGHKKASMHTQHSHCLHFHIFNVDFFGWGITRKVSPYKDKTYVEWNLKVI